MKKIIVLLSLLLLTGCTKNNEQMEYIFFKSSATKGTINRAYDLTYNEWISEETIEKLKEDPEVEVDEAYMFPIYYQPNGINVSDILESPLDWHLILNGEEVRNKETGLRPCVEGEECLGSYQYFGIAPFKNIEELENNCVKKFNGELKEGYIPMYIPEQDAITVAGVDEINKLPESYSDELLLIEPVMTPTGIHDGVYDMKIIYLYCQIVGFYKSPTGVYDYIPLEDMNRIVQENAENEIKPMDYIITTNKKKAKQIQKMEDYLHLCQRWTKDKDYYGNVRGIVDETYQKGK